MSNFSQVPPLPEFPQDPSLIPYGSLAELVHGKIDIALHELFTAAGDKWASKIGATSHRGFEERRAKLNDSRFSQSVSSQPNANLQVPFSRMSAALERSLPTTFAGRMNEGDSHFDFTSGADFQALPNAVIFSMKPSCSYVAHEAPRSEHDLGIARVRTLSAPPVSIIGTWVQNGPGVSKGSLPGDTGFWKWEWLVKEGEQAPKTLPGSVQSGPLSGFFKSRG